VEVSSLGVWEEGAIIDVGSTASPLEAFLFLEDDSPDLPIFDLVNVRFQ